MTDTRASVRPATADDLGAIAGIFAHYVTTSTVTFEEDPPTAAAIRPSCSSASRCSAGVALCGVRLRSIWYGKYMTHLSRDDFERFPLQSFSVTPVSGRCQRTF